MNVLTVILGSAAATYFWRALGAAAAGKINAGSRPFRLAACIAFAMVAALILRMLVYPAGITASAPLLLRLAAAGLGLAVFALFRRNVAAGAWASAGVFALFAAISE